MYIFYRRMYQYYFFFPVRFLGLAGNQPLFTRFSCSKSSRIDQKEEKAATPATVEEKSTSINTRDEITP